MYAREGDLARLNRDRNNPTLPMSTRREADKAMKKIEAQMKDRPLMAMRERLVKASRAGDEQEIHRITLQMKAHQGEELESGLMQK